MLIAFQRDLAFERARASGHCSGDLDYINALQQIMWTLDNGHVPWDYKDVSLHGIDKVTKTMIRQLLDVVHADQKLYLVFEFLDKVQFKLLGTIKHYGHRPFLYRDLKRQKLSDVILHRICQASFHHIERCGKSMDIASTVSYTINKVVIDKLRYR